MIDLSEKELVEYMQKKIYGLEFKIVIMGRDYYQYYFDYQNSDFQFKYKENEFLILSSNLDNEHKLNKLINEISNLFGKPNLSYNVVNSKINKHNRSYEWQQNIEKRLLEILNEKDYWWYHNVEFNNNCNEVHPRFALENVFINCQKEKTLVKNRLK